MQRLWLATSAEYGSGLPANLGSKAGSCDINCYVAIYGSAIVSRVDFQSTRVRPNCSLDAEAGATLYHKEGRDVSFEIAGHNITDKVNVLNFASLFSGTAVAPPASVSARLKFGF